MQDLLAWIEALPWAAAMRSSRWGYAILNGSHILGIALLVGAVVPLNLKLLGLWPSVAIHVAARILAPIAACGLTLAVAAGLILFSVRAQEYASVEVFQAKLILVLFGTVAAMLMHLRHGWHLTDAPAGSRKTHALISLGCWLGALYCGRFIAFSV